MDAPPDFDQQNPRILGVRLPTWEGYALEGKRPDALCALFLGMMVEATEPHQKEGLKNLEEPTRSCFVAQLYRMCLSKLLKGIELGNGPLMVDLNPRGWADVIRRAIPSSESFQKSRCEELDIDEMSPGVQSFAADQFWFGRSGVQ